MWRWWSYALGRKEGRSQSDADAIALIRTVILLMYMTTNCFIIAGVIRHWNDNQSGTVAELVDAPDLKSVAHWEREGSSPSSPTRSLSSAVELLVYTESVGGSIPSASMGL